MDSHRRTSTRFIIRCIRSIRIRARLSTDRDNHQFDRARAGAVLINLVISTFGV